MLFPSKTTLPAVFGTKPVTGLTRVVLPAPLGPTRPTISPFGIATAPNDAAGEASVLWTTFITFQLYLAIAFGSETYRELFLETPTKLPLLNATCRSSAFSWWHRSEHIVPGQIGALQPHTFYIAIERKL